ncbi:choice-of-anchor L domain-containing protein, partial [Dokdonia ponticola]
MRSKLLLLIALISFATIQAQITVDNTILTDADAEMLVSDVLIGGSGNCAQVSNVTKSTGIDFGGINNGIGSFDATGTDFPFEAGVVLVSGSIDDVPGPNTTTQGNGNWVGDADLEANTTAINTNDASFIQFDFLPSVDNLSFNFIMASEEYDQNFECTFSDAFAFILTDLTTGVVQNLAVLPGTTIPIEVTNIHPEVPGQCAAINEEFFDRYNFLPFNNPNTSATNFNGQTVPLTATSPVTSGNPYRIKLVVADQGDSAFDIAVFLEAGSFNLGVDLGEDLTFAGDTNACAGDTVTLDASASNAIGVTFQWQVFNPMLGDFEDIVGEIGPTLDVTDTGVYQVLVDSGFGCVGSDSIVVEFALATAMAPPDQIICDDASNDGTEVFNLNALIDPLIIGTQDLNDVDVTFHLSQADADTNTAALTGTIAYNSPTDEIFVRVESAFDSNCFDTASFMLIVQTRPMPIDPATVDPGLLIVCDNAADGSDTNGLTVFNLASLNGTIFGAQDPTAFTLTYHLNFTDADLNQNPLPLSFTNTDPGGQTIFVRLENDAFTDCYTVIDIDLVVAPLPVIIDPAPLLTQCDDDTDGFSVFNLTEAESLISADATNETFQYFDSLGNPIADPIAYTNSVINNETLDVLVTTVNGCSRPAQLLLEVDTSQIPPDFLVPFEECDTDGDGVAVFDFTTATPQILALFPPGQLLTVTYYETLQEAQSEINPITNISNYTNNIALTDMNGVQGIYVRVDGDTANDCVGLGIHVQLTVLPNPVLNTDVSDFIECSDDADFGIFDLTSKDIEITGGNPDY